jgi:hypothetical protein
MRYAIRHKESKLILHSEPEAGFFLVPEDETFLTFGKKKDVDEAMTDLKNWEPIIDESGTIEDDMVSEDFEIIEL